VRRTLHLYLLREILAPFLAALLFLTQLFVVMRLLAQAEIIFGSGALLSSVGKMLLYLLPSMLAYGMPVAFLLGILVGFGRLSDDRELTALAATGHGPHVFLPTPLLMGAVLTLVMLVITTWLEPLGMANARALMNSAIKRNLAGDVKAGTFYEDLSDLTVFAETVKGRKLQHVLVNDERDPSAPLLVVGETGQIDTEGPGGSIVLKLKDGELHRAESARDRYAVAHFDEAGVAVVVEAELSAKNKSRRALETYTSAQAVPYIKSLDRRKKDSSPHKVEFQRRFAHPFVMLAFALVGVAGAATSPASRKGGKAVAFGWTLGSVVLYFVLGKVFATLGGRGMIPYFVSAWAPVLIIAGAAAAVFLRRRVHGGAR
jgi:lipopolysaccharide export system permease protein